MKMILREWKLIILQNNIGKEKKKRKKKRRRIQSWTQSAYPGDMIFFNYLVWPICTK